MTFAHGLMVGLALGCAIAAWRETSWRLTIGATLAQVRARRTATLAPPVEPAGRVAPVADLDEIRKRRLDFDRRAGSYKGRPS